MYNKGSGGLAEVVVPHPCRHPRSELDGALSTDGAVAVPVCCRDPDQMAFKSPFQLKQFCDSMI